MTNVDLTAEEKSTSTTQTNSYINYSDPAPSIANQVLTSSILTSNQQSITPKLTRSNYQFWKSQVLSAVGAHDLVEYLAGIMPCPAPFIRVRVPDSFTG